MQSIHPMRGMPQEAEASVKTPRGAKRAAAAQQTAAEGDTLALASTPLPAL